MSLQPYEPLIDIINTCLNKVSAYHKLSWIKKGDATKLDKDSEPEILNAMMELVFGMTSALLETVKSNVTKENIKEFDQLGQFVQNLIIEKDFIGYSWEIDYYQKLAWISAIYCCHNCPNLLPVFLSEIKDNKILMSEDSNGYNLYVHAMTNLESFALINTDKRFDHCLYTPNSYGFNPIELFVALARTSPNLITSIDINKLYMYTHKFGLNILHLCALVKNSQLFIQLISNNQYKDAKKLLLQKDRNQRNPINIMLMTTQERINFDDFGPIIDADVFEASILENSNGSLNNLHLYIDYFLEKNIITNALIQRNYNWFKQWFDLTESSTSIEKLIKYKYESILNELLFCVQDPKLSIIFAMSPQLLEKYKISFKDIINNNYPNSLYGLCVHNPEYIFEHKLDLTDKNIDRSKIYNSIFSALNSKTIMHNSGEKFDQITKYHKLLSRMLDNIVLGDLDLNINNKSLLVCIFDHYPTYFRKFIKENIITSKYWDTDLENAILESKETIHHTEIVRLLFDNNIINKEILERNNYAFLLAAIKKHHYILNYIFESCESLFDKDFNGQIFFDMIFTNNYKESHFEKIIQSETLMPTHLLNKLIDNKSIIHGIQNIEDIKYILEHRPDFDTKLLWEPTNILVTMIDNNKDRHLLYFLNHSELKIEHSVKAFRYLFDTQSIEIQQTMFTVFLNRGITTASFEFDIKKEKHNIMHHLIRHNLINFLQPSAYIKFSEQLMNSVSNNNSNILLNFILHTEEMESFNRNNCIQNIINNPYFKCEMLFEKNADNISVFDYMKNHFIEPLYTYYINKVDNKTAKEFLMSQIIPDHNHGFDGKITIAQNIALKNNIILLLEYACILKDKTLLFHGTESVPFQPIFHLNEEFIEKILSIEINRIADIFKKLNITLDDLLIIKDNHTKETILYNLIVDKGLLDSLVTQFGGYTVKLLQTIILEDKSFMKIGISFYEDFIDFIPFDILISKEILSEYMTEMTANTNSFVKLLKNNYDKLNGYIDDKFISHVIKTDASICIIKELVERQNKVLSNYKFTKETLIEIYNNNPVLFELLIKNDGLKSIFFESGVISMLLINDNNNKFGSKESKYNSSSFDVLCSSNLITTELLLSKINNNILIDELAKKQLMFEYLLKNKIITNDLLCRRDRDGDMTLYKLRYNAHNFENLFNYIDWNILTETNKIGQTIFHSFATNNESIKQLIKHKSFDSKILEQRDHFGKMCLDYVVETKQESVFDTFIKNKLINDSMIKNIDTAGVSMFEKILVHLNDKIKDITHLITYDVLAIKNGIGMTNLMQLAKYSRFGWKWYLDSDIDKNLLDINDSFGNTYLMTMCCYNSDNLELTLGKYDKYIKSNHLYVHKNMGSCLTKIIKYNPQDIRHLLESKIVGDNLDVFQTREDEKYVDSIIGMNIVQLSCKYSPDSLSFLLSSKYEEVIRSMIYENIGSEVDLLNSFKIAIIYQPDCISQIIKSKYYTKQLLNDTINIMPQKNLLLDSFGYQPQSFVKLLETKSINGLFIDGHKTNNDTAFKRIQNMVNHNKIINENTNYLLISNLFRYKDTICDNINDINCCQLCSFKQNKVLFLPCLHKCCVSCGLKIPECHICRGEINQKIVFTD
jgi:hypothetical protein